MVFPDFLEEYPLAVMSSECPNVTERLYIEEQQLKHGS